MKKTEREQVEDPAAAAVKQQELEILKAVAQAWHGHTNFSIDSNEFDTRRRNFKSHPSRFRLEAAKKKSQQQAAAASTTRWDFGQSLWDAYEIVAVSRRIETGLVLDDSLPEFKWRKEKRNSLRSLFNQSSKRFTVSNKVPK